MKVISRFFRRGVSNWSSRQLHAFCTDLKRILDRPEPDRHQCGCCGRDLEVASLDRISAQCFVTGCELRRVACSGCGAVQGPLPLVACSTAELGALYRQLYRFYSEGASAAFQEKTFYLMNPSMQGRYLNYACGDWSVGLAHLRSLGWRVWGYEPFQRVRNTGIVRDLKLFAEIPVDGLMTHNYLEHVQNPAEFFESCAALLVEDGVMAHSSACYEYVCETSPFHLFFYCGDAVAALAERSGFTLIGDFRADTDVPGKRYNCRVFRRRRGAGDQAIATEQRDCPTRS